MVFCGAEVVEFNEVRLKPCLHWETSPSFAHKASLLHFHLTVLLYEGLSQPGIGFINHLGLLFSICNTYTHFPYFAFHVLLGALCSVQWPIVGFGTISTIPSQILYY